MSKCAAKIIQKIFKINKYVVFCDVHLLLEFGNNQKERQIINKARPYRTYLNYIPCILSKILIIIIITKLIHSFIYNTIFYVILPS